MIAKNEVELLTISACAKCLIFPMLAVDLGVFFLLKTCNFFAVFVWDAETTEKVQMTILILKHSTFEFTVATFI